MKKILLVIVAFLNIAYSIGFNTTIHYCMGKFAAFSILINDSEICPTCGMRKHFNTSNNKCCKDVHRLVKSHQDQKNSEKKYIALKKYFSIIHFSQPSNLNATIVDGVVRDSDNNNFLRYFCSIPLYLNNSVFRI